MVPLKELIKERFKIMETSIINKLKDVKIVQRTFVPEGGQPIDYKQLVLVVVINGNSTEVQVSLKADKALILQAANELTDEDFLDNGKK